MTSYTVQAGDSVYQIAQNLTGADRSRTVAVAEQILDLNLGRAMTGGQRFTNAAYIEPGWILHLPVGLTSPEADASPTAEPSAVHVVERGETLWSIAGDELDTPTRWPEIWEQNRGKTMAGDRVFDDPDLIVPGWVLDLPMADVQVADVQVADVQVADVQVADVQVADVQIADEQVAEVPVAIPDVDGLPVAVPSVVGSSPTAPSGSPSSSTTPLTVAPAVPFVPPSAATVLAEPIAVDRPADVLAVRTAMSDGRRLFGLEHAAMLSVGVLTLVGVHRLRRLRAARPRARVPMPSRGSLTTERVLRAIGADERLLRVDIAIRAAASQLSARDRQILAVMVDVHGAVEIALTGPCPADEPFISTGDRWHLAATTATDSLVSAARPVGAPCVSMVQLGVTCDGRDLYVDLEALRVLAVDAAADRADAVVNAIAMTLGTSVLAEVSQLVGVGLDPAAFVGHRHHVGCDSFDAALDLATSLLGSTALASEPTFALRSRVAGGEAWEPAIVLVASEFVGEVSGALPDQVVPGLALVVAGHVDGAHHALIDMGSTWRLDPLGIDVVPLGLDHADLSAITELVEHATARLEAGDDLER